MRLSCRFSGKVRERVEVGGEIRKQWRKNLLSRKVNQPRTCKLRVPAVAPLPWTEGVSPAMLRQSHCPQTLTGTQRRRMSSPEPSAGCEGTHVGTRDSRGEATCPPILGQLSAPAAVGNQEPLLVWVALPGAEWPSGRRFTSHTAPGVL